MRRQAQATLLTSRDQLAADRHMERGIGFSTDAASANGPASGSDRVLRAKYLDWCASKIAERFLQLTPDEIYELAQRPARPSDSNSTPVTASPDRQDSGAEMPESVRDIVERVTEVLAATLQLPSFADWADAYGTDPSQYDGELAGFWKEQPDPS